MVINTIHNIQIMMILEIMRIKMINYKIFSYKKMNVMKWKQKMKTIM